MHCGEKQDLGANVAVLAILIFDVELRGQENQKIYERQSNGELPASGGPPYFRVAEE